MISYQNGCSCKMDWIIIWVTCLGVPSKFLLANEILELSLKSLFLLKKGEADSFYSEYLLCHSLNIHCSDMLIYYDSSCWHVKVLPKYGSSTGIKAGLLCSMITRKICPAIAAGCTVSKPTLSPSFLHGPRKIPGGLPVVFLSSCTF